MRISLLPSSVLLLNQMPHLASLRATGHSGPAGVARESPEAPAPRIPRAGRVRNGSRLQRTSVRLGSQAEAGARLRGWVKNNSIETSKTFGFILGGGMCFFFFLI